MKSKTYLFITLLVTSFLSADITGTVTDQTTGYPIQDVNITAGNIGTSTNQHGEFSIDVPLNTLIEFSHIGYKSIHRPAEDGMVVRLNSIVIESDEIIVRAGLTDESLQKVTASVSVLTADEIRESGATHFQSLTDQIPNLNWAGGTSRPRYFQIRGIGENSHYFGEGAPNFSVGFVLDDMDLSGLGMLGQLYDLNQIEIFRGPQSSVYGANALAGLISLRSSEPTDEFELKSQVSVGSDNLNSGSSLLNLKLVKGFSMRLVSQYATSDGFRENVTQNVTNTNKREESFHRLKLKFEPNEKLDILTTIIYSELENGYDAWAPDNNTEFKTYTDAKGEDSQLTYGYSVRGDYALSETIGITSITSFTETDLVHAYDGDWADSAYWHDNHGFDPAVEGWEYSFFDKNEKNRANLTQEIRLAWGPLILGGYFKHLKEQDDAKGYLFGGVATDANSLFDYKANAGYVQYSKGLTSSIKMNASLRYEKNQYDYTGLYQGLNDNWEKVSLPSVSFKIDDSMVGYKTSLLYSRDEETLIYGTISQGYKSGGVNQQPYLADENRPFNPEYIKNFEFGVKRNTELHRLNFSIFYAKRASQQVSISSQQIDGDPNSFLFFTANAGSGNYYGFELVYHRFLTQRLAVNGSMSHLTTYIDQFTYSVSNNVNEVASAREAAMAPELMGAIGLNYRNDAGIHASVSASYKGDYYFSDSHNQKSEPYSLLNFNVGKSFGKTQVSLWVQNALDERYTTRGFYFGLIPPDYPDQLWKSFGDPRQIGLTIDYSF